MATLEEYLRGEPGQEIKIEKKSRFEISEERFLRAGPFVVGGGTIILSAIQKLYTEHQQIYEQIKNYIECLF